VQLKSTGTIAFSPIVISESPPLIQTVICLVTPVTNDAFTAGILALESNLSKQFSVVPIGTPVPKVFGVDDHCGTYPEVVEEVGPRRNMDHM